MLHLQAVIRAVCTIIDAFHFQPEDNDSPTTDVNRLQGDVSHGKQPNGKVAENVEGSEADDEALPDANSGREITNTLARRVLPVLQSALVLHSKLGNKYLQHLLTIL